MRLRDVLALPLLALPCACQAFTDPGYEYVDCVRSEEAVELFEGSQDPPAALHCWDVDNASDPAYIRQKDGDLVIHPLADASTGAQWTEAAQAPLLYRSVSGDFLAVTRAEAVSTQFGDHCLGLEEEAGLIVRQREPYAWARWLVRPNLPADAGIELCGDEADPPPYAEVRARSFGFDSEIDDTVGGVGDDGEAYIALCRHDDVLSFFYQNLAPRDENPALTFQQSEVTLVVGFGELDVGLTATGEQGAGSQPEGHFNWLVLLDFAEPPADGCSGALEQFQFPEPE